MPEPKGKTTAPDAADLEKEDTASEDTAAIAEDEPLAEDAEPVAKDDEAAADEEDSEPERSKYAKAIKVTPRAPLPKEPEFATGEFTPHGIGGAKRPALKKTTKSGARMRAVVSGIVVIAVVGAGVGFYAYREATKPKLGATGALGKAPKVTIPSKEKPSAALQIKSLVAGKGPKIAKGDLAVVNFVGYTWNGKQVANTYKEGQPQQWTIGQLLPGLDKGVTGQPPGGRVMLTIPPKDGFGQQGNQQLGVAPTDTLVFVIDILGSYNKTSAAKGTPVPLNDPKLPKVTDAGAGKVPTVAIPKSDPPKELEAKTLIEGTGPAVRSGQAIVAQYEGRIWKGGKVFDSTWQRGGTPAGFPIGKGQVVPGWDKGLVGKKVGSRVLLVLPPKEGYGKQGASQAGIKPTDTLVFVIDIVGAH